MQRNNVWATEKDLERSTFSVKCMQYIENSICRGREKARSRFLPTPIQHIGVGKKRDLVFYPPLYNI